MVSRVLIDLKDYDKNEVLFANKITQAGFLYRPNLSKAPISTLYTNESIN